MPVRPQPKPSRESREKRAPFNWEGFSFPRPTTARDRKFARDAAREFACAVRGRTWDGRQHRCGPKPEGKVILDFAHIPTGGKRGTGLKGAERGGGIILCRFAHQQQHAWGWVTFADRYRIDPYALARQIAEALRDDD